MSSILNYVFIEAHWPTRILGNYCGLKKVYRKINANFTSTIMIMISISEVRVLTITNLKGRTIIAYAFYYILILKRVMRILRCTNN